MATMLFCPFCGFRIPSEDPRFCPGCGHPLDGVISPAQEHDGLHPVDANSVPAKTVVQPMPAMEAADAWADKGNAPAVVKPREPASTERMLGLGQTQTRQMFVVLRDAYRRLDDANALLDASRRQRRRADRCDIILRCMVALVLLDAVAAGLCLWLVTTDVVNAIWQVADVLTCVAVVVTVICIGLTPVRRRLWSRLREADDETSRWETTIERIRHAVEPLEERLPSEACNAGYVTRVLALADEGHPFAEAMMEADDAEGFAGRADAYDGLAPLEIALEDVSDAIDGAFVRRNEPDGFDKVSDVDGSASPKRSETDHTQLVRSSIVLPVVAIGSSLVAMALCMALLLWALPARQRDLDGVAAAASYCSDQYQRLTKARDAADSVLGKVSDADGDGVGTLNRLVDAVGNESCSVQDAGKLTDTAAGYRNQVKAINAALADVNKLVQAKEGAAQKRLDLYTRFQQIWNAVASVARGSAGGDGVLDGTYCREDGSCLQVTHGSTPYRYGSLSHTAGENPLFDDILDLDLNYQSAQATPSTIISIYLVAGHEGEMCGSAMEPGSSCRDQYLFYVPVGMDLAAADEQNGPDWMLGQYEADSSNPPDDSKAYLVLGRTNGMGKWESLAAGEVPVISDDTVFYLQ